MPAFDQAYFDALYGENIDPWNFRASAYEQRKYAKTMSVLAGHRFERCLELGCSIGVLTRRLAACCSHIVAIDTSEKALEEAKKNTRDENVEFRQCHVPDGDLGNHYDLVMASEILYYLERPELIALAARLVQVAEPHAWFVSVHWTGPTNYPLSAHEATDLCFEAAAIERVSSSQEPGFRIDVGRFP